jgi:hypothetical protein
MYTITDTDTGKVHMMEDFDAVKNFIYDNVDMDRNSFELEYDEFLDDVYGKVNVCGAEYYPSILLQKVDPVRYRVGKQDYVEQMLDGLTEEEDFTLFEFDVEFENGEEEEEEF